MHSARSTEPSYARRGARSTNGVLLAVLALSAACTEDVAGTPEGAAGFGPATRATTTQPGEQAQRRLDGVDTCLLLIPADLDRLGGVESGAQRNALLPQSCSYDLARGAPEDVAAVAFYKPLEQARSQAPRGTLVDTHGYPTWLVCGVEDGYQSCSAAVAVRLDRTLLVLLSRRDVSATAVQADLEALTHTALSRLPMA